HHRRGLERTIHDAMHTEPLTVTRPAHDHRTSTMKVDPDILSIHRGLPSSEEDTVVRSPESPTRARNLSRGAEAPPLHRISYGVRTASSRDADCHRFGSRLSSRE